VTGQEVVQLYSHALDASVPTPLRRLQGFERIELAPGESRTVVFEVAAARLGHWSEELAAFQVGAGNYEFTVGRSSADLPAGATVKLESS
jgi:beta-glucosidase